MAGEGGERGQNPKPLHFLFMFSACSLHFSVAGAWRPTTELLAEGVMS